MTIAEVSKRYDLTSDTLRYYERVGLIPNVNRTAGGIRNYQEEDCKWIEFIKCLRSAGLPIDVLIEYVRLFQLGDSTIEDRKALLIAQRGQLVQRIAEMQETLKRLDYKIDYYENFIIPNESQLSVKKTQ